MLDIQTGGAEMLSSLERFPPFLVATEGWAPNVSLANERLRPRGGRVVVADDERDGLPFADAAFDLVTARHPTHTDWSEVARVLSPGGTFLSQQVGPHSMRELTEYFLGPQGGESAREPAVARDAASRAGLEVTDLRTTTLRTAFFDIGAIVYYLRLVGWIVPKLSVERHRKRLEALDERIRSEGAFVAYATRFLIEAVKPA